MRLFAAHRACFAALLAIYRKPPVKVYFPTEDVIVY